MPTKQNVWFITGTSGGLGLHLVISALARGDHVVATVRHLADFSLPDADKSRLHVIELDVTEGEESLKTKVEKAIAIWGRIDILVNNAGYVSKCMVEEGGSAAALAQFQVNFFGTLDVTNAVLPHMRSRKAGTIVFIGSRTVWHAHVPTAGFYIASKAAIHSISETLAAELAPFGIRVILAAPGEFRTEGNNKAVYSMNHHVGDYDGVRELVHEKLKERFTQAKGDPAKAMDFLVDVVRGEGKAEGRPLPPRLLLGAPTYEAARAYCERLTESMDAWEDVATSLDFDEKLSAL
ncbi:NAD(P)-binding protein [Laetiporus sulphureus 93-53]|uniref:NAD(P)-binding protein n=1 Tax=Laetiporus sulphureus 93-53 TaxID=1314785 RepID=A0A165AYK1_9APHY|nr:NAD(P)-binding protein [Laetiporus sulphureus 93-53]KZS99901.1 NAD(P)-binding protein [Laetiporus sulphureus 93-53]